MDEVINFIKGIGAPGALVALVGIVAWFFKDPTSIFLKLREMRQKDQDLSLRAVKEVALDDATKWELLEHIAKVEFAKATGLYQMDALTRKILSETFRNSRQTVRWSDVLRAWSHVKLEEGGLAIHISKKAMVLYAAGALCIGASAALGAVSLVFGVVDAAQTQSVLSMWLGYGFIYIIATAMMHHEWAAPYLSAKKIEKYLAERSGGSIVSPAPQPAAIPEAPVTGGLS